MGLVLKEGQEKRRRGKESMQVQGAELNLEDCPLLKYNQKIRAGGGVADHGGSPMPDQVPILQVAGSQEKLLDRGRHGHIWVHFNSPGTPSYPIRQPALLPTDGTIERQRRGMGFAPSENGAITERGLFSGFSIIDSLQYGIHLEIDSCLYCLSKTSFYHNLISLHDLAATLRINPLRGQCSSFGDLDENLEVKLTTDHATRKQWGCLPKATDRKPFHMLFQGQITK